VWFLQQHLTDGMCILIEMISRKWWHLPTRVCDVLAEDDGGRERWLKAFKTTRAYVLALLLFRILQTPFLPVSAGRIGN
jgi:hypothetical protein